MVIHVTKITWRKLQNQKHKLQRKKHQLQIKQRRLQIKEGLLQAVGTTGQTANTAANVARQTSAFLQEAAHMEGSAEVAEVLLSLAQALTEDTSPKAAASVLEEIGKVAEKMDKKLKVFQAVQQVEIMIRDIVVLRCLACIDPMDREAFINASKCAFDKKTGDCQCGGQCGGRDDAADLRILAKGRAHEGRCRGRRSLTFLWPDLNRRH